MNSVHLLGLPTDLYLRYLRNAHSGERFLSSLGEYRVEMKNCRFLLLLSRRTSGSKGLSTRTSQAIAMPYERASGHAATAADPGFRRGSTVMLRKYSCTAPSKTPPVFLLASPPHRHGGVAVSKRLEGDCATAMGASR